MSEWKTKVYPGSSSLSTRSRGSSFPRDVWSCLAFSPPPGWADTEKLHVKQNEATPRGDCLKLKETLLVATNGLQNVLTVKSNLCRQFDLICSFEYWNLKLEAEQFHKNRQREKKHHDSDECIKRHYCVNMSSIRPTQFNLLCPNIQFIYQNLHSVVILLQKQKKG